MTLCLIAVQQTVEQILLNCRLIGGSGPKQLLLDEMIERVCALASENKTSRVALTRVSCAAMLGRAGYFQWVSFNVAWYLWLWYSDSTFQVWTLDVYNKIAAPGGWNATSSFDSQENLHVLTSRGHGRSWQMDNWLAAELSEDRVELLGAVPHEDVRKADASERKLQKSSIDFKGF